MARKNKIEILDTTLREGEQSRGILFTTAQKIKLAEKLDCFGVDFIELGHPAASPSIRKSVAVISSLGLKAQTVAHARAKKEDIDIIRSCKTAWAGIFSGINSLSLDYRLRSDRKTVAANILNAIKHAKDCGLKVRFTCEDASRTDRKELIDLYAMAVDAGADRICVADTVGILTPSKTKALIAYIKKHVTADMHVHLHNDFGLASANALAAYEAGASAIDVSINGLGERSGVAALAEVCMALKQLYTVNNIWDLKLLPELSAMVSSFTRSPIEYSRPIVGRNVFSHKGGIHSASVMKNPETYEPFPPEILGIGRTIVISRLIGRQGLEGVLKPARQLSHKDIEHIIGRIKNNGNIEFTDKDVARVMRNFKREDNARILS
ncbi:MAG: 2-isopropylmalate synthase [Nitrospirae bacterium]|nr:2-isopropylmalate synthase [Nitrospirota bacterium]